MKPIISVIIPAYNEEKYIKDTLISLKNQDFDLPYEVIVCDNNSTDKTIEIAKKHADKVLSEKKQGGGHARNTGAKAAKGKYFVFTDADTIFPRNYLKKAHEVFLEDKYVAFSGWFKYGKLKNKTLMNKLKRYVEDKSIRLSLFFNKTLPGFSFCMSKEWFDKSGGFTGIYPEDIYMTHKLSEFGETKFLKQFFVYVSPRRSEEASWSYMIKSCLKGIKIFLNPKIIATYTRPWEK